MAKMDESMFLRGLCRDMCPERERNLREKQRRLHPLEIDIKTVKNSNTIKKVPKANINTVVKEYSRPAAGKELDPSDLRPASVLVKTMDYLLTDVLNKASPWYYKCEYISDRIRAVRQDLTAQNIQSLEAIDILEKATRYYLIMAVKLSQEPLENYDPVLHYTHTKECLKKLLSLYELHKKSTFIKTCNQASFEACNLLLNLDSTEAFYHILRLNNQLKKFKEVELAIHLKKLHLNANFTGVFRVASKLPYLESCALFSHIQPMRCQGLLIMNTAFSSKNLSYPLPSLTEHFYFDSDEVAAEFCNAHSICVKDGKVFFHKGEFIEPTQHYTNMCHKLIGSKFKDDISDVILHHTCIKLS